MNSLTVTIAGATLPNPLVLASGILGSTGSGVVRVARSGAGAVTAKSVCVEPRKGHPSPTMVTYGDDDTVAGMLNAVGLSNPGADAFFQELQFMVRESPVPVFASIFSGSGTIEEFGQMIDKLAPVKPALIEVDISCPHVSGINFAHDPDEAAKVTRMVKSHAGNIPIAIKLSPNARNIAHVAQAVEQAGADVITAVNTLGPGMLINIEARKPILGNKRGGVSGAALKPVALRCVYDIYDAVHIPIIGTGGVSNGRDAIEMMMAGATAVGVGTAVLNNGPEVFKKIVAEMEEWMKKEGVKDIREIIGAAHA